MYTEYDDTENLLDMPLCKRFFEIFPREFKFYFYGVDIIVDERTGVHYFVDCNYLSNYANIPQNELIAAVDSLIGNLHDQQLADI